MRYAIIFPLIFLIFAIPHAPVHAAGAPQLIVTWAARSYYPLGFTGRPLPTAGTPITLSVEATVDGKLMDLSNASVAWYKDGDRFDMGTGLKTSTFNAEENDAGAHFIRVVVTINTTDVEQMIRIPVTKPVTVLETPYPHRIIPAKSEALFTSVPYFFNAASIQDFIFSWAVGDLRKNTGSDNTLSLNVGEPYTDEQRTVTITTYAQNRNNPFEVIKNATDIFVR